MRWRGYAMGKIGLFLLAAVIFGSPLQAKEYAIIKDTMFGTQKIEIYQNMKDALTNYTGEGKIYEITKKEIPIKRIESRKKIEVSEYKWIVEDKGNKPAEKATDKPAEKTADKPAEKATAKK
jgi:hypothetical protein